jgi:hypothetical protein
LYCYTVCTILEHSDFGNEIFPFESQNSCILLILEQFLCQGWIFYHRSKTLGHREMWFRAIQTQGHHIMLENLCFYKVPTNAVYLIGRFCGFA